MFSISRNEESHFGGSLLRDVGLQAFKQVWFIPGEIESIRDQIELNIGKLGKTRSRFKLRKM